MRKYNKFMIGVLAVTLTINSSAMVFANDEISLTSDNNIEEIVGNEEELIEEIIIEEIVVEDIKEVESQQQEDDSKFVSNEEELIEALKTASGDATIYFDVNEILLDTTIEINSNNLDLLTLISNNKEPINFINNGAKRHINITGNGDIKLNVYDLVFTSNKQSSGGISANHVNNIEINGLTIKDNDIKITG